MPKRLSEQIRGANAPLFSMNVFQNILNISADGHTPSNDERKVVCDVLEFVGCTLDQSKKLDIIRVDHDFFYALYLVQTEKSVVQVKLSPHENLFYYERILDDALDAARQANQYTPMITPVHLGNGRILKELYYSVSAGFDSFPMSYRLPQEPEATLCLFAGLLQNLTLYPTDNLKTQKEVYDNVFQFHKFKNAVPPTIQGRFDMAYPDIGSVWVEELAELCGDFYKRQVLNEYDDDQFCLGPLRDKDVFVSIGSACPFISFAPHIHKGSPIVDCSNIPWALNFDYPSFVRQLKYQNDAVAKEVEKILPVSWVPTFYSILLDEVAWITLNVHMYGKSHFSNSAIFKRIRPYLSLHEEFSPYIRHLDTIFLEKLLN